MLEIGSFNQLDVVKIVDFGVYLDGGERGEILLPSSQVPIDCVLGSRVSAFLYFDSDDLLIATTQTPRVQVGCCEYMTVVDVNAVGAFLDWGLAKDLLVPFNEQQIPMRVGERYVVYAYHDQQSDRIVASSKLSHHLSEQAAWLKPQQGVRLQIAARTDLGFKAVVDDRFLGLIFADDAYRQLSVGERLPGFVKQVRSDGKLDLLISQASLQGDHQLGEQIIQHLVDVGGSSALSDKSSPEAIYQQFKVSKKKYKQALGSLYRSQRIVIAQNQIHLST